MLPSTQEQTKISAAAVRQVRATMHGKPGIDNLLTPEELADASPFYFVLRSFVHNLKAERERLGLSLAELAQSCAQSEESLTKLESGQTVNPTWQVLGRYAAAVGGRIDLSLIPNTGDK